MDTDAERQGLGFRTAFEPDPAASHRRDRVRSSPLHPRAACLRPPRGMITGALWQSRRSTSSSIARISSRASSSSPHSWAVLGALMAVRHRAVALAAGRRHRHRGWVQYKSFEALLVAPGVYWGLCARRAAAETTASHPSGAVSRCFDGWLPLLDRDRGPSARIAASLIE